MVKENFGEQNDKEKHVERIRYLLGVEFIFNTSRENSGLHIKPEEKAELEWYRKNHPDWVDNAILLERIENYVLEITVGHSMSEVEKIQFEDEFKDNDRVQKLIQEAKDRYEQAELNVLLNRRNRLTSEKDFDRIDELLEKYPDVAGEVGKQEEESRKKQKENLDEKGMKKFTETLSRHLKGYFGQTTTAPSMLTFAAQDYIHTLMERINNHPQKIELTAQAIKEALGEDILSSQELIFDFLKTKYEEVYHRPFDSEDSLYMEDESED